MKQLLQNVIVHKVARGVESIERVQVGAAVGTVKSLKYEPSARHLESSRQSLQNAFACTTQAWREVSLALEVLGASHLELEVEKCERTSREKLSLLRYDCLRAVEKAEATLHRATKQSSALAASWEHFVAASDELHESKRALSAIRAREAFHRAIQESSEPGAAASLSAERERLLSLESLSARGGAFKLVMCAERVHHKLRRMRKGGHAHRLACPLTDSPLVRLDNSFYCLHSEIGEVDRLVSRAVAPDTDVEHSLLDNMAHRDITVATLKCNELVRSLDEWQIHQVCLSPSGGDASSLEDSSPEPHEENEILHRELAERLSTRGLLEKAVQLPAGEASVGPSLGVDHSPDMSAELILRRELSTLLNSDEELRGELTEGVASEVPQSVAEMEERSSQLMWFVDALESATKLLSTCRKASDRAKRMTEHSQSRMQMTPLEVVWLTFFVEAHNSKPPDMKMPRWSEAEDEWPVGAKELVLHMFEDKGSSADERFLAKWIVHPPDRPSGALERGVLHGLSDRVESISNNQLSRYTCSDPLPGQDSNYDFRRHDDIEALKLQMQHFALVYHGEQVFKEAYLNDPQAYSTPDEIWLTLQRDKTHGILNPRMIVVCPLSSVDPMATFP